MEEFIKFLESSTIHGLSHIASSRRCLRVFWIAVVVTCFIIAGGIIQNSVLSWEETPVVTTIETLPITEVTFPLVTVCPPRNRLTNLNYDLLSLKNAGINNSTKTKRLSYKESGLHFTICNPKITNCNSNNTIVIVIVNCNESS